MSNVNAQNYAVQSTVQIMPPYSVYLSDYATDGNEKLRVILIQHDLSRPVYQLRLVMTIELNGKVIMRTSRYFNPAPISLDPGVPTVIAGAELAPYVDSRNIDFIGYSKDQYDKTKALPEGSYQITFTAYDYRRQDQQVSNAGSSFYYLAKNEPPLVNYPACGTTIPLRSPQQIIFSWLPRNTSSPTSAQDTEYELSLYETRPSGRNPNDVVLSTQPVYRTRTDYTQFIYGPTELMLLEGMVYVWRVQAIDRNGKDAFRNNGYSQVCTFTYGGVDPNFNIGVVKGLQATGETAYRGKISWDKGNFDSYKVFYKKTGAQWDWFSANVDTTSYKIFDLEPDTEYEVRVQGKKDVFLSPYTDIIKFRTKEKVVVECGDSPPPLPEIGPPLKQAFVGMTFTASDVRITVTQIENLGGGWFKGYGQGVISELLVATYNVKFDRLYIDENLEAGDGDIYVISKGAAAMATEQLAAQKDRQNEKQQEENQNQWAGTDFYPDVVTFDYAINTITPDASGNLVITQAGGETVVNTEVPTILAKAPDKAVIIQDKNGDQFVVQKKDGQTTVTKVEGGGLQPGSDNTNSSAQPDPIKDRIIVLILEQFEEEIGAWLRMNGKGGEDDPDVLLALELPACFNKDVGQLTYLNENTIPYFKEHPAELRDKIEANKTNKTLFDKIAGLFKSKDDVAWGKVSGDDQEASRDAMCKALMDDIAPLISFYEKVKPLLDDDYTEAVKRVKAIVAFFKQCNSEEWESYEGEGIIPYCFWRDQATVASAYYSNADVPFVSGLIDGAYSEAEGLYHLPEVLKDISKYPGKVISAYTYALWKCSPQKIEASAKEYRYVIEQLVIADVEGGPWNWLKEQWNDYESQKEDLDKYFKDCGDAKRIRDGIDKVYEIVSSTDEIIKLYGQVSKNLQDYFTTLNATDNIARYKQGKLVVPVIFTVLTVGEASVTKIKKLKTALNSLREATAEKWKKVTEGIGKLLAKEVNNLLDTEGKFVDNILETDYQKYVKRKTSAGKTPRERLDWKEVRDYWLNDSPMARGNAFNDKAKQWYNVNELNLENGKRLDSYVEPKRGNIGEIISRKATNLEEIDISTFESYLKEMRIKYAPGTKIRSNKYPDLDGDLLKGKQILEIPSSNQNFSQIQDYVKLAATKYNIEVRFKPE